jgi:hypothetical protein
VENTFKEREEEVEQLKANLLEEKQKSYDNEATLKEGIAKHEAYAKALKAEVNVIHEKSFVLVKKS